MNMLPHSNRKTPLPKNYGYTQDKSNCYFTWCKQVNKLPLTPGGKVLHYPCNGPTDVTSFNAFSSTVVNPIKRANNLRPTPAFPIGTCFEITKIVKKNSKL